MSNPDPDYREPEQKDRLVEAFRSSDQQDATELEPTQLTKAFSPGKEPKVPGVFGDFRLIRVLGKGGMGVVYEASQESLGRRVAVKVMSVRHGLEETQRRRFVNESMAVARMEHPHIIPVYNVGEEDGVHYFSMRLVEGLDLRGVIKRIRQGVQSTTQPPSGFPWLRKAGSTLRISNSKTVEAVASTSEESDSGPQSLSADSFRMASNRRLNSGTREYFRSVAKLGSAAASALHHAHSLGILHRDIKPGNLMLDESNHLWVMDFGLAQIDGGEAITQTGDVLGTYRYMSPEQASGRRNFVDLRTDIYSLGVTLYELLTLEQAVSGTTQREVLKQLCFKDPIPLGRLNPTIPFELQLVIHKAIERDPADRYQSAESMEADLQRFVDGQPIMARKPTLSRRVVRWVQSHKQLATAIAGVGFVLLLSSLAVAGVVYQSMLDEKEQRQLTEAALQRSEGLRLLSIGALQLDSNPGLALSLAVEGARKVPGREATLALQQALDRIHETKTLSISEEFLSVAMSADGRFCAHVPKGLANENRRSVIVWTDLARNETLREIDVGFPVWTVAFHPSSKILIGTALTQQEKRQSSPVVCRLEQSDVVRVFPEYLLDRADEGIVSNDAKRIVLCHRDGSAHVIDLMTMNTEVRLANSDRKIRQAIFSVSGQQVITVADDGQISVWSVDSGLLIRQFQQKTSLRFSRLNQTQDGRWIVVAGPRGAEYFAAEAPEIPPVRLSEQYFAESPANSVLFVADRLGKSVRIMDSSSLAQRGSIDLQDPLEMIQFGGEKLFVLLNTDHGAIVDVYDGRTLQHEGALKGHLGQILALRFCDTLKQMVTAGTDQTIRFWLPESGKDLRTLVDYPNVAKISHQFSPNGEQVAIIEPMTRSTFKLDSSGNQIGRSIPGRFSAGDITDSEVVVCRDGKEATIFFLSEGRSPMSIFLPGQIMEAKRVPGKPLILLRSTPEDVWRWNFEEGGVRKLSEKEGCVYSATSASGNFYAVGYRSGEVDLWDSKADAPTRRFRQTDGLAACAVGDDLLATLNGIGQVSVRNLADGEVRWMGEVPVGRSAEMKFVQNDSALLVYGLGTSTPVTLMDSSDGNIIQSLPPLSVRYLRQHETQPLVTVVTNNRTVHLWNLKTGEFRQVSDQKTSHACFTKDALVVERSQDDEGSSGRSEIAFFDFANLEERKVQQLDAVPTALTSVPQTGEVLLTTQSGSVAVFNYEDGKKISQLADHRGQIRFVGFLKTEDEFLTVSADQFIRRFKKDGTLLQQSKCDAGQPVIAAMSPDAELVAVGTMAGTVELWNTSTLTKIRDLPGHTRRIHRLTFGNQQTLVSGSLNEPLRVWDLRKNEPAIVESPQDIIEADINVELDQVLVVEGKYTEGVSIRSVEAKSTSIIDTKTGVRKELFASNVNVARYSPRKDRIGVLMKNGQLHILDAVTFDEVARIVIDGNRIGAFCFSPVSNEILSWQEDGLSVWSTNPLRELYHASTRETPFDTRWLGEGGNWDAWNPNGKSFITFEAGVLRWSFDLLAVAEQRVPRELTESEKVRFEIDGAPAASTNSATMKSE